MNPYTPPRAPISPPEKKAQAAWFDRACKIRRHMTHLGLAVAIIGLLIAALFHPEAGSFIGGLGLIVFLASVVALATLTIIGFVLGVIEGRRTRKPPAG